MAYSFPPVNTSVAVELLQPTYLTVGNTYLNPKMTARSAAQRQDMLRKYSVNTVNVFETTKHINQYREKKDAEIAAMQTQCDNVEEVVEGVGEMNDHFHSAQRDTMALFRTMLESPSLKKRNQPLPSIFHQCSVPKRFPHRVNYSILLREQADECQKIEEEHEKYLQKVLAVEAERYEISRRWSMYLSDPGITSIPLIGGGAAGGGGEGRVDPVRGRLPDAGIGGGSRSNLNAVTPSDVENFKISISSARNDENQEARSSPANDEASDGGENASAGKPAAHVSGDTPASAPATSEPSQSYTVTIATISTVSAQPQSADSQAPAAASSGGKSAKKYELPPTTDIVADAQAPAAQTASQTPPLAPITQARPSTPPPIGGVRPAVVAGGTVSLAEVKPASSSSSSQSLPRTNSGGSKAVVTGGGGAVPVTQAADSGAKTNVEGIDVKLASEAQQLVETCCRELKLQPQKYLEKLMANLFVTTDDFRDISMQEWSLMGFPLKLAKLIRKRLR